MRKIESYEEQAALVRSLDKPQRQMIANKAAVQAGLDKLDTGFRQIDRDYEVNIKINDLNFKGNSESTGDMVLGQTEPSSKQPELIRLRYRQTSTSPQKSSEKLDVHEEGMIIYQNQKHVKKYSKFCTKVD